VIWPFWTTLRAILCSIFSTLKPGVVLFSTMKPLTWLSATSRAQMIETSHHPGIAVSLGSGQHAAARSRTDQRLGQAEAADLFEAGHGGEPLALLLLRAVEVDRAHGEATVHAPERAERSVDARQFHRDEAEQLLASARAAVALEAQAADWQLLERRQQLEGKRIVGPILVDDRLDFALHVRPHLLNDCDLVGGQNLDEPIEVAVRGG
jgi:hypothetical protein